MKTCTLRDCENCTHTFCPLDDYDDEPLMADEKGWYDDE